MGTENMPSRQKTDFDNRPVGIFDSGLGGLTVVSAIRNFLPEENLVYLGDTARVPYGNRSAETVVEFALQDLHFLMEKNVKAVVIACNTVSAVAVDRMRQCCPEIPISGVIVPGVQAVLRTGSKKVTVLGTRGTIRSGAYEKAILESCPD